MDALTEAQKLQGQAHIAEYQAMMTRMNSFMSFQLMVWVPLVAFIVNARQ